MKVVDLLAVASEIERAFVHQDKYVFAKYVTEFKRGNEFGGDHVTFIMIDPLQTPPMFYEVTSPFDLISGKAPQLALAFSNGECVLNTDYTEHAAMRTGIMDALVLRKTRHDLHNLKILLFGSGKTATWSVKGMATITPDIKTVDYWSKSGKKRGFEEMATEVGIKMNYEPDWHKKLGEYDVIICHTNATEPILKADDISRVKAGVEIHSFIGSSENGEIADEFYLGDAKIVSDWPHILEDNKIMQRARKKGMKSGEIVYLKELFGGKPININDQKRLICQFGGTPIQNLAVMKVLIG